MDLPTDRKIAVVLVLCAISLKAVDTAHGLNSYVPARESYTGHTLVSESTISVAQSIVAMLFQPAVPNTPVQSAAEPLRIHPTNVSLIPNEQAQPNVVLVLVESMGKADAPDRDYLSVFHRPSLLSRYQVEFGDTPFNGSTVSGEYRELCGLRSGARIGMPELSHREECLPEIYNRKGYETEGIHGYQGSMFGRESWYAKLGFQRSEFLEQLRDVPGMHICEGTFPGICDTDVAHYVGSELKRPGKKKFIHWITLNTHLPIARSEERERECGTARERDVCELELLLQRVLNGIADLADDPDIPPTEFIVVGDHSPPFATLSRRDQFDQHYVPFVRLIPKAETANTVLASSPKEK